MGIEERWKIIAEFDAYAISDFGRVRSLISGKVLKPSGTRYKHVSLRKDGKYHYKAVHRLVLIAFKGPAPEGKLGLHNDDNPMHNHVSNLRWGTALENQAQRKFSVKGNNYPGRPRKDEEVSLGN